MIATPTIEQIVRGIPKEKLKTPRMVREDNLLEARDLAIAVQRDSADLLARRIDSDLVASYPSRIDLYERAAAKYYTTQFEKTEARFVWEQNEAIATPLKWDILDEVRFACRGNKAALAYANEIAEGQGYRDTVADFCDLPELINNNRGALEEINFDFKMETACIHFRDTLSKLLGKMEMSPTLIEEHRLFMFQAFTYMQNATETIREFGQHVFRKNPEKLDDYKSDHYQQMQKSAQAARAVKQAETPPPASSYSDTAE